MRIVIRTLMTIAVVAVLAGGCVQLPPDGVTIRAVIAPDAPALSSAESQVINVECVGDCVVGGRASWVTSDAVVAWEHEDPVSVDEYEVWRATNEPYFSPETCEDCEMVATTTALVASVEDSPPGFNPVGSSEGFDIRSGLDVYLVRARNAGGSSGDSNRVGAVSWSLRQGGARLPEP